MNAQTLPWIILFAPLVAAIVILFFGKYSRPLSAGLAIFSAALGCVLSWWLFLHPATTTSFHIEWMNFASFWAYKGVPAFHIPIGFILDPISRMMLVVVTSIATLVFIYSLGYMRTEEGYWRYFAGLALFLFSMLGIVLADNFVMMFMFWELVGVSSYILIGHYYGKDSAAAASKQAFIVNRIGDFGFMTGILLLWVTTKSIVFSEIEKTVVQGYFHNHELFLTIACVLVFCGTVGKSAQLPLHVWLPNSMEGPTPVSSLLHAATMVAAGVYMLARIFPILAMSPDAMNIIAWVGGITLFVAALMATQQNDIKRILAYSTISQLGYMVLGIGVAPTGDVALFHLFTHACFKCLLFLSAGSVIVGMHHEQDIWKMGALKNKMPFTFLWCAAGAAALSAVPFTSGHYSKDLIIAFTWAKQPVLFWLALITAGLTAFYIGRLFFVVFFGPPRSEHARHCTESPKVMTGPMFLLALAAIGVGWPFIADMFFVLPEVHAEPPFFNIMTLAALAIGLGGAVLLYFNVQKDPISIPFFANRMYIDNFYTWLVKVAQDRVGVALALLDRWLVDWFGVRGSAKVAMCAGIALRLLQIGNIQAYAFFFGAGVVTLIYLLLR
ncbi:MAG: NADH-quinone oxidoreductase subunit L [Chthoniobacterales bacterium]